MAFQKKSITPQEAQGRLELLCVRAEHCRHELAEKLHKWGIFGDTAEKILDDMAQRRFFDDARFAQAYVRDKLLYSKWGRLKISAQLRAKRIPTSVISEALDTLDPEEYTRVARDFLTAKARTIKDGLTFEGRTRLYRAGLARGFESSVIAPIVKSPSIWPQTS